MTVDSVIGGEGGEYIAQASKALDFMQKFDGSQGELSETDKSFAVSAFKELADDLLLRATADGVLEVDDDQTEPEDEDEDEDDPSMAFAYYKVPFSDGSSVRVEISVTSAGDSEAGSYSALSVNVVAAYGEGSREESEYELAPDSSCVTRLDRGDPWARAKKNSALNGVLGPDQLAKYLANMGENRGLEIGMGLNGQPVSLDEILSLKGLIEHAEPDPDADDDN